MSQTDYALPPVIQHEPDIGSRPSASTLLGYLVLMMLVQMAVYGRSFGILPAADDFAMVCEINRGNEQGVSAFFTHSVNNNTYRPIKSVGIWLDGKIADAITGRSATLYTRDATEHELRARVFVIRCLNFASMALYAWAGLLWIAAMRPGRAGAVVGAIVLMLHPVLPQSVGSIDSFDSLLSTALMWLGAYAVWRYRHRMALAAVLALLCFAFGSLIKEYIFGLVPLAGWILLVFRRKPWPAIIAVCIPMLIALVVLLHIRQMAVPPSATAQQGFSYLQIDPLHLVENAGIILTGILFVGNSVWVYLHRSTAVLAGVAASMGVVVAFLAAGIWLRTRAPKRDGLDAPADAISPTRWFVFLLLAIIPASFPVNVMGHVSEMYLPPVVLPFALLCVLAADGFARASRGVRVAAICGFVILVGVSICTIILKIEGLRDVGARADAQLRQIMDQLPYTSHDQKITVLFRADQVRNQRTYAVFLMADPELITQPESPDWIRPGHHLDLQGQTVPDFDEVDPGLHGGYVFGWDAPTRKMTLLFDRP